MPRNAIVTGGGGFVGQWVARALLERGDRVWLSGLGARPLAPAILTAGEWAEVHWVQADVRIDGDIDALLEASAPDLVVHLAGISSVGAADSNPGAAFEVNVCGAVRLLSLVERRRQAGAIDPAVLIVGSGTQYGSHPARDMPLGEAAEQRPLNAYASSKAAQETAALQFARSAGLRVICTRSFNHSGPGHGEEFFLPSLVRRVRTMSPGGSIAIGNDVVRDYLHVADVARAYLDLAEHGVSGEVYNVASGTGVSVSDLATTAIRHAGRNGTVVSDAALRRKSDIPVLIGSREKLTAATGWRPTRNHQDIIDELLSAE